MRRWAIAIAVCCLALFAGVVYRQVGASEGSDAKLTARQAEERYYRCQPRHWRDCLLQR